MSSRMRAKKHHDESNSNASNDFPCLLNAIVKHHHSTKQIKKKQIVSLSLGSFLGTRCQESASLNN